MYEFLKLAVSDSKTKSIRYGSDYHLASSASGGVSYGRVALKTLALIGATYATYNLGTVYQQEIIDLVNATVSLLVSIPIRLTLETFKAMVDYVFQLLSGLIPGMDDIDSLVDSITPWDGYLPGV